MNPYKFYKTTLPDAQYFECMSNSDLRGGFSKIFEKDIFESEGISFSLNETFASVSAKNVIRGIHFQTNNPQAKIVTVLSGRAWDVIVDLRVNSNAFKKWYAIELSNENHRGFYVPKGFGHGFVALEDNTIMLYQCDGKYDAESDSGVIYNDKELCIEWPINDEVAIHSDRDLSLQSLQEYISNPMRV